MRRRRVHQVVLVGLALLASGGLTAAPDVAGAQLVVPPPWGGSLTAIEGAPFAELVVDRAGRVYASSPARNEVVVYAPATRQVEARIGVGPQPQGVDLSPNETTLYVANSGDRYVSVVDLSLRLEIGRIYLPDGTDRPYSIATASNGRILLTTTFSGSGFGGRMMELKPGLILGTATRRTDFWMDGSTTEATRLKASGDRSRIGVAVGDISSGPAFLYHSATNSFSPEKQLNGFVSVAALDGTGSRFLVNPGTFMIDPNLVVRATIPSGGLGVALNSSGTRAYRVQSGWIDVLDLDRGLVVGRLSLVDPQGPGNGMLALSADGTTLVVLTAQGIALVPIDSASSTGCPAYGATPSPNAAIPGTNPGDPGPDIAVCGAPLAEVVADAHGYAYASNPEVNQVEVVNLATGTREAPIYVGSQPRGLDLSADGTKLYVANSGAEDVSVVDLALRREVSRITVHSIRSLERPFSIAVTRYGTALVSTKFSGFGFGARIVQLNLLAGTVGAREDFWGGRTLNGTRLKASGDRSKIGIVVGGSTAVFVYDTATDSFTSEKHAGGIVSSLAVDQPGSRLLVNPGTFLLDGQAEPLGTIPSGGRGVAINGAGTTGYRVQDTTVEVLDVERRALMRSLPLRDSVAPGDGMASLTPDGRTFVVLTRRGVEILSARPDTPPGDYDGDRDTDIAVFRPASGHWFLQGGETTQFGTTGDIPVPGDYDGDGDTDIAVFRPDGGFWFVRGGETTQFGTTGDIPVPDDYNGDGHTDIAVFRPEGGYWFIEGAPSALFSTDEFGTDGDIPVPGDYDGDGHTDIAVFRPDGDYWFVQGGETTQFGTDGDIPVSAGPSYP